MKALAETLIILGRLSTIGMLNQLIYTRVQTDASHRRILAVRLADSKREEWGRKVNQVHFSSPIWFLLYQSGRPALMYLSHSLYLKVGVCIKRKWKEVQRRTQKGNKRKTCIMLYTRFLMVIVLMLKLNMLRCLLLLPNFIFFHII